MYFNEKLNHNLGLGSGFAHTWIMLRIQEMTSLGTCISKCVYILYHIILYYILYIISYYIILYFTILYYIILYIIYIETNPKQMVG
jgi:hypothetical protein